MDMVLQEGGVLDDGMRRDPVSGNEVPPGSLATEVRDDIPAQLSEGEYIVPADVLRYFGVAFFEDLRAQAKDGLARMDADGRIGGEPMPMDDDVLPFSPEELQVLGGDMDAQMMASGMTAGGMTRGYNVGGSVAPRTTYMPAFLQRFGTVGGTLFEPAGGPAPTAPVAAGETDTRMYVNDRGNMIAITFIDGVPQQEIPQGFRPLGEVQAPEVTPIGEGGGGAMWSDGMTAAEIRDAQARGDFTPKGQTPSKRFADYTAEDWANWNPTTGERIGSIVGALGGAFMGGAAGARLGQRAGEALMGRNTVAGYKELNDFIGKLDINDPLYGELSSKRDDLYSELVEANSQTQGGLGGWFRETFGLSRPEIPAPTRGVTTTAATAPTGVARTPTPTPSLPATSGGASAAPTTTAGAGASTAGVGRADIGFGGVGGGRSDSGFTGGQTSTGASVSGGVGGTSVGTGTDTSGVGRADIGFGGTTSSGRASSTPSAGLGSGGIGFGGSVSTGGSTGGAGLGFSMGEPVGGSAPSGGGHPGIGRARGGLMGNTKPKTPNRKARRAAKKKYK